MDGVARAATSQYDADGNRTQLTADQGFVTGYNYDGLDRMVAEREISPTGPQTAWITYDQLGRRSSLGQGYTTVSSTTTYAYDGASRLQAQGHDLAGTGYDQTLGFGYNPASQIVQRTRTNGLWEFTEQVLGTKSYVTNGLNQYVAAGPNSYGYDANGNLKSDGTNVYVYDAENRLVSVGPAGQQPTSTLSYDPLGRLWRFTGPQSGDLRFLYDGDKLTTEEDPAGVRQRVYAWGPGVDEPFIWYELLGGVRPRFLHADHQGSIVALADLNGNPVAIDKYDEWGVPAAANMGRFQYTGQAWLPDLGLYYYKARMYSSRLGRFLQTDPVGYKDQVNLYAYVGNDPVTNKDPSGMECNKQLTMCRADTSDSKRATIDVRHDPTFDRAAVAARKEYKEADKDGNEPRGRMKLQPNGVEVSRAAGKSGVTVTGVTANMTLTGADAGIHGHIEGSIADDTKSYPYGDTESLKQGKVMYTVEGDRVGVHDAPGGRLQFEMIRGRMTPDEAKQVLINLNEEQNLFMTPK